MIPTIVFLMVISPLVGCAIAAFLIAHAYRVSDRRIARRYPHWADMPKASDAWWSR